MAALSPAITEFHYPVLFLLSKSAKSDASKCKQWFIFHFQSSCMTQVMCEPFLWSTFFFIKQGNIFKIIEKFLWILFHTSFYYCYHRIWVTQKNCKKKTWTLVSMTSLFAHKVAQPTKWRFLPKNLNQLVIFVIGLATVCAKSEVMLCHKYIWTSLPLCNK